MMGKWVSYFPYATKVIVTLGTGQEGSDKKMKSNATSRDGYTGSWSNTFWPHEESKRQDPTDDEWDVEDSEWEPVKPYYKSEPVNTPPTAPEQEGKTEESLAIPEPELNTSNESLALTKPGPEIIIQPRAIVWVNIITPKTLPKPTSNIIDESPADPKPDPPPPAPQTPDTIQDITKAQDHARPRNNHRTYRPKIKWKEVERILATSKGDHQLVTSKGGNVYRGRTVWLKGCVGILQCGQPNGLLSYRITIGDARATRIGKKDVDGKTRRDKRWMIT